MTFLGKQHTEETKKKISESLKGNRNHRGKKGYHHSEEARRRISESLKGRQRSKEHRQNLSKALKGRQFSEEDRQNLSKAKIGNKNGRGNKGRPRSEETKRKISATHLGIQPSEETRKKISESLKGRQLSGEHRQNISKGNRNPKGGHQSEEYKQKIRIWRLNQKFLRRDTSIEIALQNELSEREMNYETHLTVCGICQPDIVFPELKIAVFADGDYWHSPTFKDGKIWKRDRNQDMVLKEQGWKVQRFWGHEIRKDTKECVDKIIREVRRFND